MNHSLPLMIFSKVQELRTLLRLKTLRAIRRERVRVNEANRGRYTGYDEHRIILCIEHAAENWGTPSPETLAASKPGAGK